MSMLQCFSFQGVILLAVGNDAPRLCDSEQVTTAEIVPLTINDLR
jgi:hypothetical protein